MRITLVYHGRYWVRQALELETLAALMRTRGHEVALVYESDTFGLTDNVVQMAPLAKLLSSTDRIVQRILASHADLVLMSVLPGAYGWAREVAGQLKARSSAPIAFAGLHPSLVPERVMADAFVDYVIQGELENAIHPLLDAIAGEAAGRDALADVPNLWYRREGRVVANARAELVDLDALPLPDKELFRPYISHAYSYAAMVSRGCPYRCTFCEETCSKELYGGRYYRRKSVNSVMAELIAGKRQYRFREVIFKDSYLSGNTQWLAELMDRYRREVGVPFKCFCTIDGFDEQTARLLKQGGCYSIEFGLQTWNESIRRDTLGRNETNAQALAAFAHCADHKLWYDVDHMFNLPGESIQDHLDGVGFYRRLRYLNRVKVHYLVYLPTARIIDHGLKAEALPADVRERLADGWESDFYDQKVGSSAERASVAGFAALYKLLPVLPAPLIDWLLRGRHLRMLARIPSPMMAVLQGLAALRSGDLRFLAYLRLYPVKIARAIIDRLNPRGWRTRFRPQEVRP